MRETVGALIERFGLLMVVAASTALLHFYGGLPYPASILLGLAFTIIGIWLHGLRQIVTFRPYRLTIGVVYETLWRDFNLIPADGPRFENTTFTAISAALFARSDERTYSVNLDLYKDIPCGAPTWARGPGQIPRNPTFFLRPDRDGYQFGVRVDEIWWKQHNSEMSDTVRAKTLDYGSMLTLGFLPYGYIPEHVRRWNVPLLYASDWIQRRWTKKLQREGWTIDEDDPTQIRHRYLAVSYHEL